MAQASFSNHDAVLHENYGNVNEILQTYTEVWNRLPENQKLPDGKQYRELIAYQYPTGVGAYGPRMQRVPDAQTSAYNEAIIQMSYQYGTLAYDWVLEQHNKGEHSYIDIIDAQMRQFTQIQLEHLERQTVADGSGRLGHDYSGVLTTNNLRGRVDRQSDGSGGELVVRMYGSDNAVWFREGMAVEFMYDTSGSAASPSAFNTWNKRDTPSQGYYTVKSIAVSKSSTASSDYITITMNEPPVGAGNDPGADETTKYDVIVKDEAVLVDGGAGSLNAGREMFGLDSLIDDGDAVMQMEVPTTSMQLTGATMHGIASTSNYWQSEVVDGSGSYYSLDLAQQVAHGIARRSAKGSENIQFQLMDHFQARKYSLSLTAQERYPNTGAVGQFSSGNKTMFKSHRTANVADKEIVVSRFQLRDRVHLVGTGIKRYVLKPWGWITVGGGIWHRNFSGAPRNEAEASAYLNIGVSNRTASGKIEGLKAL